MTQQVVVAVEDHDVIVEVPTHIINVSTSGPPGPPGEDGSGGGADVDWSAVPGVVTVIGDSTDNSATQAGVLVKSSDKNFPLGGVTVIGGFFALEAGNGDNNPAPVIYFTDADINFQRSFTFAGFSQAVKFRNQAGTYLPLKLLTETELGFNGKKVLLEGDVTGGGGGASSLNDLTDVDTATVPPTSGQALVWDGTQWEPGTISGGGGASSTVNGPFVITGDINGTGTDATQARLRLQATGEAYPRLHAYLEGPPGTGGRTILGWGGGTSAPQWQIFLNSNTLSAIPTPRNQHLAMTADLSVQGSVALQTTAGDWSYAVLKSELGGVMTLNGEAIMTEAPVMAMVAELQAEIAELRARVASLEG